jgi:hypothetical protein
MKKRIVILIALVLGGCIARYPSPRYKYGDCFLMPTDSFYYPAFKSFRLDDVSLEQNEWVYAAASDIDLEVSVDLNVDLSAKKFRFSESELNEMGKCPNEI